MRLASVNESLVDDVLARPVLDTNGMILLGEGVRLNERLIERLRGIGVYSVYIHDARTEDVQVEDAISEKTRRLAIQTVQKSIEQLKTQTGKNSSLRMASREQMGRDFSAAFQQILSEIQSNPTAMISLASIYTADGYLYHHSVNVTILATVLGLAKGYNQRQLTELGVGAMMHDVGMLQLPSDLITKAGVYTPAEFEMVKQHTVHGYEYLKKQDGISTLSAHVALQHHERVNGSGYPRGLKGNEIHEYAQIVGICDVFDAMNSARPHRPGYLPHDTLEYLMAAGNSLFDYSLVSLFVKNVAIYPLGLTVTLNSGESAVIVSINPEYPQRPVVRLISSQDGTPVETPIDLDLTKHTTLMITGLDS